MLLNNPNFGRASPKEIFCQLDLYLFNKLLMYYSSSFLIWIVLDLIKVIHNGSRDKAPTAALKTFKRH